MISEKKPIMKYIRNEKQKKNLNLKLGKKKHK